MDFGFTEGQQRFIEEIREFCAKTPKGELADPDSVPDDANDNFSFSFYRKMCDKGWAGLVWPKEYGGLDLGNTYQVIFNEEMQSQAAPISVAAWVIITGWAALLTSTEQNGKSRNIYPNWSAEKLSCFASVLPSRMPDPTWPQSRRG